MRIIPKRKITLATAKGRAKTMTSCAAAIHRTVYKYVLADFIQQVNPDLDERFQNPEMNQRPITGKGGGQSYVVSTDLKNFDLLVEMNDSPTDVGVRVVIQVRNPFSSKDEVVVDAEAEHSVSQEDFNTLGSKLVTQVVNMVIKTFKEQVKSNYQQLKSNLESLEGQARFMGNLLNSFSDPEPDAQPQAKAPQQEKRK